ncbi:MAG TPA: hypothetical protein VKI44_37935 [Acetobacteraceae bacterium]|nr:hypothetical protein [Acetobacteraceae bacterium]
MTAMVRNARDVKAPVQQQGFLPLVVSDGTQQRMKSLQNLKLQPSPGSVVLRPAPEMPLEEQLYDALARVKVLTSAVAMHLDRTWRGRLFQQLDALHDTAEWEPGDAPVQEASFATFLRTIIALDPDRRPGLGLTCAGHLIGAWTVGRDRLTLEFLPNGNIQWLLSCYDDEQVERAAGEASVGRLPAVLAPYRPARWFGGYARQPAA